jgi:dihydrofolate reductase
MTAKLVYPINVSLDGYIEDEHGAFAFFPIDEEVFAAHTELVGSFGTLLYGRRLYEDMAVWETNSDLAAQSPAFADFSAVWQAPDKIVYSRSLETPSTARTRIEREFNPDVVRDLKANAARDIAIGGANLASQALQAGLVDEIQLYVVPVIVGGGKPGLPEGARTNLELIHAGPIGSNGVVLLRYRPQTD